MSKQAWHGGDMRRIGGRDGYNARRTIIQSERRYKHVLPLLRKGIADVRKIQLLLHQKTGTWWSISTIREDIRALRTWAKQGILVEEGA